MANRSGRSSSRSWPDGCRSTAAFGSKVELQLHREDCREGRVRFAGGRENSFLCTVEKGFNSLGEMLTASPCMLGNKTSILNQEEYVPGVLTRCTAQDFAWRPKGNRHRAEQQVTDSCTNGHRITQLYHPSSTRTFFAVPGRYSLRFLLPSVRHLQFGQIFVHINRQFFFTIYHESAAAKSMSY